MQHNEQESMELKVLEKTQVFSWNYEAVKQTLEQHIKQYANLVVNDENLPSMEKTQKEIASLRVRLTKFKMEVKKELEKPYLTFEVQLKELLRLVESAEAPIKDQLDKYEVRRREEKAAAIQALINNMAEKAGLEQKFSSQIVVADKYLNRTATKKEINEDIESKIKFHLDLQKKEKEADSFKQQKIKMAKFMCETLSAGLATPLTFYEVENRIDNLDLDQLQAHIEREVSRRKEQEERAAQQALERAERERQEAERKAAREKEAKEAAERAAIEKAAREAAALAEQTVKAEKKVAVSEELPVSPPSPTIEPIKEDDAPPKEKLYNAQFVLYGVHQESIMELKALLEKEHFNFNYAVKEVV